MSRKPENLKENTDKLLEYCNRNDFLVVKINKYQYRVAASASLVDVWPSRMKIHIIASENPVLVNDYRQLSSNFMADDLDEVLK